MPAKPKILSRAIVARSRIFCIEELRLQFANGARANYERLTAAGGVVTVMAVSGGNKLQLIREYAAGSGRYELGLVKGRIDPGETPRRAALRELKEEIGFGARRLQFVRAVQNAPAYTNFVSHIFIARDLYPCKLPGDEAEPPQLVEWPVANIGELYRHREVNDARVLLALMLLEKQLRA